MNITELARILKINPNELRNFLPRLGFDIGRKAIKINQSDANRIINNWPFLKGKIETWKAEERKKQEKAEGQRTEEVKVEIGHYTTVREFAALTGLPINVILAELMKNGIFSSLNEKIDFDTAWLIGSALGVEVKRKEKEENSLNEENKLKLILAAQAKENMLPRPPVVVVMGHVDHGKTKLLDAIRKTNVAEREAGGITQHIGAYQVLRNNQVITFIDTPGHEAFTAMRSRGARVADIAVLVVAADDGVMPQTVEAFRIIQAAKIPFIVAINKIDKPAANLDKVKQELASKLNILTEDWGGQTVCVPLSALTGAGVGELLDMIILLTETEAENIKANPSAPAVGTVIESHIDKGAGPVATILVQNGTLKIGDDLVLNNLAVGKVRMLTNYLGEKIEKAGPSAPAQIIGLKILPQVGDIIQVGEGERIKAKKVETIRRPKTISLTEEQKEEDEATKKINIVIKSDVLGSAEAICESLEKLNTNEVKVKIIHRGLGNISEKDIKAAEAAEAQIFGFNVKVQPAIEEMAREKNIKIKIYRVIYDLINDIKEQMQSLVAPVVKRVEIGRVNITNIFRTEKNFQVIGGRVISGRAEVEAPLAVKRGEEEVGFGKLARLQSGRQDVRTCEAGQECGIQYEGKPIVQKGDVLVVYKEEKTVKKI